MGFIFEASVRNAVATPPVRKCTTQRFLRNSIFIESAVC